MDFAEQSNNKVEIYEKELIRSKRLVKDLTIDAERVCLEYETLQNKCIFREITHEALFEKWKE